MGGLAKENKIARVRVKCFVIEDAEKPLGFAVENTVVVPVGIGHLLSVVDDFLKASGQFRGILPIEASQFGFARVKGITLFRMNLPQLIEVLAHLQEIASTPNSIAIRVVERG